MQLMIFCIYSIAFQGNQRNIGRELKKIYSLTVPAQKNMHVLHKTKNYKKQRIKKYNFFL